jgi:hypothetical protein
VLKIVNNHVLNMVQNVLKKVKRLNNLVIESGCPKALLSSC